MSRMQRLGGAAALTAAVTFVIGFVMAVTVLADYTIADPAPDQSVAFVVEHQTALYLWHLIIYVVFGIALVPLVLALHERVKAASVSLAQTAAAFGVIWAALVLASGMIAIGGIGTVEGLYADDRTQAEAVWSAIDSVQNALGGGIEIVGGLWVLLVSAAARRGRVLSTGANYLGVAAGAAGIVTVIPALEDAGAVFGLGLIVWFVWVGTTLLRSDRSSAPAAAGHRVPRSHEHRGRS